MQFPAALNSQRPEERVRAAKQAVDYPYESPEDRRTALEMLVARLDDEDDAVRLFAILALERMTGTRHGYNYHASVDQRIRAVQAWRRYLQQQADTTTSAKAAAHAEATDAKTTDAEATVDVNAGTSPGIGPGTEVEIDTPLAGGSP